MFLNYPGDVVEGAVGRMMGPDLYGAWYEVVSATYDADTGRTRAQFRPIGPDDQRSVEGDAFGLPWIVNV